MVLLDTNAWIWWASRPDTLPQKACRAVDEAAAAADLCVSVISVWEIAVKISLGKLQLGMQAREWVERASLIPGLRILPLVPDVALASTELSEPFHRDPADRMIVAQARKSRATLVTSDRKILDYPHVKTLWE